MKQLELDVTIKEIREDYWELEAMPIGSCDEKLIYWCCGNSKEDVLTRLYKSMCEPELRYWYILKDK